MIENHYTTEFTVHRMEDVNETGEPWKQERVSGDSFYGHKQRIVAELSEALGISFTKGFTIWCPVSTDVYEGDEIIDDSGKSYNVKAINKRDYGINEHLEVIAEQNTEYSSESSF